MEEIYTNGSGAVLRDGDRVRIEYVPEPGVNTPFGVLTDGEAFAADDLVLVEFAELVKSVGQPGRFKKVTLVATPSRPNLMDLARRALEEARDR